MSEELEKVIIILLLFSFIVLFAMFATFVYGLFNTT